MRGIVAEVKGKQAIILAQDGTFQKIRASAGITVGNEIDLDRSNGRTSVIRLAARVSSLAAAALLAVGIGYGAYCYTLPYTYVDVDINPSVELTANVFDRIIEVKALNDDAKKLVSKQSFQNAKLDDGVSKLLALAVEKGYLSSVKTGNPAEVEPTTQGAVIKGKNAVLLTVSSKNTGKSLTVRKNIVKKASEELARNKVKSEVLAGETSIQQREEAMSLGVTPGKLALIEDAMENQPGLKLEDLKDSSVRELVKKAREKKASIGPDTQEGIAVSTNSAISADKKTQKGNKNNKSIPDQLQKEYGGFQGTGEKANPGNGKKTGESSVMQGKASENSSNTGGNPPNLIGKKDTGKKGNQGSKPGNSIKNGEQTGQQEQTVQGDAKSAGKATTGAGLKSEDAQKAVEEKKGKAIEKAGRPDQNIQRQKLKDELLEQIQEQETTTEDSQADSDRKNSGNAQGNSRSGAKNGKSGK